MHQQLWEYKVKGKIYPGVRELKRLNITAVVPAIVKAHPAPRQTRPYQQKESCLKILHFRL